MTLGQVSPSFINGARVAVAASWRPARSARPSLGGAWPLQLPAPRPGGKPTRWRWNELEAEAKLVRAGLVELRRTRRLGLGAWLK